MVRDDSNLHLSTTDWHPAEGFWKSQLPLWYWKNHRKTNMTMEKNQAFEDVRLYICNYIYIYIVYVYIYISHLKRWWCSSQSCSFSGICKFEDRDVFWFQQQPCHNSETWSSTLRKIFFAPFLYLPDGTRCWKTFVKVWDNLNTLEQLFVESQNFQSKISQIQNRNPISNKLYNHNQQKNGNLTQEVQANQTLPIVRIRNRLHGSS